MPTPRVILVIDDSGVVRVLLHELFRLRGYSVLATDNPAEAIDLAKTVRIDAAITDLNLGSTTGLELCRELRVAAASQGRAFPVWIMSGSVPNDLSTEVLAVGAAGFVRKPFIPDELCRLVSAGISE